MIYYPRNDERPRTLDFTVVKHHITSCCVTWIYKYSWYEHLCVPLGAFNFRTWSHFKSTKTQTWNMNHPFIVKKGSNPQGMSFPTNVLPVDHHFSIINICFSLCSRSINSFCSARYCNNILSLQRVICSVENTAQRQSLVHSSLLASWGVLWVRLGLFTVLVAVRVKPLRQFDTVRLFAAVTGYTVRYHVSNGRFLSFTVIEDIQ